jgi:hypothetical protein
MNFQLQEKVIEIKFENLDFKSLKTQRRSRPLIEKGDVELLIWLKVQILKVNEDH